MSTEHDIKDNLMFLCSFSLYSAPSYLKEYFGFEFMFILSCFVLISSIVPALIYFSLIVITTVLLDIALLEPAAGHRSHSKICTSSFIWTNFAQGSFVSRGS